MKFSAYMFIRNGIKAGYTFMEAIENVLPFVDEFFIFEGKSDDGTREALELFSKNSSKVIIETKLPEYVHASKDKKGILLGAAFEEARQKCNGDWLVQVQADTVFHPITILAVRYFLMRKNNAMKYDAITIQRNQYRWNWQEMYRKDFLNLIFKKSSGKVFGDAIDIEINGKATKKLLPLFKKYPAADNAWIFLENIMGKIEGCSEIWNGHEENITNTDFDWYNKTTGRSFKEDLKTYRDKKILPPFWQIQKNPYKNTVPKNLSELLGKSQYEVSGRFTRNSGFYNPNPSELLGMLIEIETHIPLIEQISKLWK